MTTQNTDNSLDEDNITLAEQLTSLARGIRRSGDSFSLFFVESNIPKQSEAVVQTLTEEYKLNVLSLNCYDIADEIFNSLHLDEWIAEQIASYNDTATKKTQAVVLIGLEQLFRISKHDKIPSIIIEMNWRRNFYRELSLPIVLILPTFAIKELATYASDFYDWYSGVYTLINSATDEKNAFITQIESMRHNQSGISSYLYANTKEKKSQVAHLKALLGNTNNLTDKSYIYNELGLLFYAQGEYKVALIYYEDALNIYKNIGDKENEAKSLNNISQIYDIQGDYSTTLTYLNKSLDICKTIGNKIGESSILNNISNIYRTQGYYSKTLSYLNKSLVISREIGNKENEGTSLNNIAMVYKEQGDYNKALDYLQQSLNIREEIYDKVGKGAALNNIAMAYKARGDYNKALEYLQHSLKVSEEIGDKVGMCHGYFNLGVALLDILNHPEHHQAKTYITKSYNLAAEMGLQNILNHFQLSNIDR